MHAMLRERSGGSREVLGRALSQRICFALVMLGLTSFSRAQSNTAATMPAATGPKMYTNPVGIFIGDPDVLREPGHYYIYGTGGGRNGNAYPAFTSPDLVNWTPIGNVLSYDAATSWATGAFWAPEVYRVKDKCCMFYSAQWRNNPTNEKENFRIGVAVSDNPAGPFKDTLNKPIFDPGYPAIDADVLFDTDGRIYLYYSRCCFKHPVQSELADWARAQGWYQQIEESWIYGVELKPDFSGIIGDPVVLIRPPEKLSDPQSAWEDRAVKSHAVGRRWTEGPNSFKHGNTYYILYSANSVAGPDYATGYATSDKPLGPFKKAANNPIIQKNTDSGGNVTTTAHTCVTLSPDGTEIFVLYGAVIQNKNEQRGNAPAATMQPIGAAPLNASSGSPPTTRPRGGGYRGRTLFVDRLEIEPDGTLIAHSPTVTPQPYPSADKTSK